MCGIIGNLYELQAQQQVMFTQYMFNGLAINPAYAGSQGSLTMTALYRNQWVGIEGAPTTQTFSLHSPVAKERMSLGMLLINDKIGITNQTGGYGVYSYRIPLGTSSILGFGIQGGVTYYNALFSQVSDSDPTFAGTDVQEYHPNAGFGMYFQNSKSYIGFSVPQLIQNEFDRNNSDSDSQILRHYFISTGYVFDLSKDLKLKPNLLVKYVKGAPVEFDLNVNLLIHEVIWIGCSWRSFDSIDALLQIQLTEQLQMGYAYDFATTTDLKRVNSGSHEFMLTYRLRKGNSKIVTPRYF